MIYIVFYRHSFFNTFDISAVFKSKKKAQEYIDKKKAENECVYATWEVYEREVSE